MIRSKLMEKHNTFLKFNPFKTPPRAALPIACMLLSVALSAQEDNLGTEVVNVVKPYTPTISDAFKVKETPVLNDSLAAPKQEVRYGIFSVPVASTFTPAKGKATKVAKAEKIRQYDNYVTLGFGNFTTVLGELYSNFEISRTDNAGFFFRHSSSQGGIDNVRLENKYYNTQLDGNYTSRERDLTLRLDGGAKHQLYNWYGLNSTYGTLTEGTIANFDAQQTYVSGNIGGTVALEGSFFEKATASLRYLTDAHSSSEFHATFQPEFSFPANNFSFAVKGDVDYVTGSFDRGYLAQQGTAYSNVNLGLIPGLVYVNSDLTLNLGIAAYAGLDLENSDMDIYLFPRVLASYRLSGDRAIVYGGAKGGLHQNTYYDFKEANPFVSPTLSIHPTQQLYDIYGGLKGKINNSIAYNLRGSYGKEEDKALLRNNPDFADRTQVLQGYELGNSFGTIYDNVNTFSVFGEFNFDIANAFSLGVNVGYFNYGTTTEAHAWNLPDIKATVFSNFRFSDKIYGGASFFYVGERMDLYQRNGTFGAIITENVRLDSYLDANLHLGYAIDDRLSVFARGSNLLGNNYEKWFNYPVQGIQALLGATYKFDW